MSLTNRPRERAERTVTMIQLNPKRFVNAAAKARSRNNKPFVRMLAWRQYQCRTQAGHVYAVRFEAKASGVYASCNCAAGAKNLPCYHVAACHSVDVAIVTMRLNRIRKLEESRAAKQVAPGDLRQTAAAQPGPRW